MLPAQGLDPAKLLKQPTDTWPTYNGDYSGRRFSPLKQINASNVGSMTLAWVYRDQLGRTAPGAATHKATPLEVNGILYFTVPDHAWAVDARTGASSGITLGDQGRHPHRQPRLRHVRDWLYFETPDNYLVCLNAKTARSAGTWRSPM